MGLVGRHESYVFLITHVRDENPSLDWTGMLGLSQSVRPKWGLKAADDLQRRTKGSPPAESDSDLGRDLERRLRYRQSGEPSRIDRPPSLRPSPHIFPTSTPRIKSRDDV